MFQLEKGQTELVLASCPVALPTKLEIYAWLLAQVWKLGDWMTAQEILSSPEALVRGQNVFRRDKNTVTKGLDSLIFDMYLNNPGVYDRRTFLF